MEFHFLHAVVVALGILEDDILPDPHTKRTDGSKLQSALFSLILRSLRALGDFWRGPVNCQ